MRLIDADALTEKLDCLFKEPGGTEDYMTIGYDLGIGDSIAVVKGQPTIDPVKHGRWEEKEVINDRKDAKIPQWQSAKCSVCGRYHTTPYLYYFDHFKYCPDCGALMDEVTE